MKPYLWIEREPHTERYHVVRNMCGAPRLAMCGLRLPIRGSNGMNYRYRRSGTDVCEECLAKAEG